MKRYQQDKKIAQRQWQKHHQRHVEDNKMISHKRIGISAYVVFCACDNQIGRFRKRDEADCGKTQCMTCHSYKFPKRTKTLKEIKSDITLQEQTCER